MNSAEDALDGDAGDAAGPGAPPEATLDRRKQLVAGLLTAAVLVFVFVGVFPKIADYGAAWDSIQEMSVASLVALALVSVLNIVVYVFPYQAALPGLPFGQGFVVRQTSFMISNAIPAGGAFGLGVQYTMLSGYGYGPAQTSSAIAATSVWNLLVTLALPALGVTAVLFVGGASTSEVVGAVVGLVAVGLLITLFMLVLRSETTALRLGRLGDRLAAPVMRRVNKRRSTDATGATMGAAPAPTAAGSGAGTGTSVNGDGSPGPVTRALLNFRDSLRSVVERRWALLTSSSFAQQFCQFLILLVAFYGIKGSDAGINPVQLFAAFAIARLAGFIPITPGGLGTVDAAMVGMMTAFGANEDDALAALLLWRAASFVPQVVLGIGTFLWWRRHAGKRKPSGSPSVAAV